MLRLISIVSLGLFIGAAGLTMTGCGDSVSEGDKIEPVDFAKKGEDSMKAYMAQKAQRTAAKKK